MRKRLAAIFISLTFLLAPISLSHAQDSSSEKITLTAFSVNGLLLTFEKDQPEWLKKIMTENPDWYDRATKGDTSLTLEITREQAKEVTVLYDWTWPIEAEYTTEQLTELFKGIDELLYFPNLRIIAAQGCKLNEFDGFGCLPLRDYHYQIMNKTLSDFVRRNKDDFREKFPYLTPEKFFLRPYWEYPSSDIMTTYVDRVPKDWRNPSGTKMVRDYNEEYGLFWGEMIGIYRYKWNLLKEINEFDNDDQAFAKTDKYLFAPEELRQDYDTKLASARELLARVSYEDDRRHFFTNSQAEINQSTAETREARLKLQGSRPKFQQEKLQELADHFAQLPLEPAEISSGLSSELAKKLQSEWEKHLNTWKTTLLSELETALDQETELTKDTKAKLNQIAQSHRDKLTENTVKHQLAEFFYQKARESETRFLEEKSAAAGSYTSQVAEELNQLLETYNSFKAKANSTLKALPVEVATDDLPEKVAALGTYELISANSFPSSTPASSDSTPVSSDASPASSIDKPAASGDDSGSPAAKPKSPGDDASSSDSVSGSSPAKQPRTSPSAAPDSTADSARKDPVHRAVSPSATDTHRSDPKADTAPDDSPMGASQPAGLPANPPAPAQREKTSASAKNPARSGAESGQQPEAALANSSGSGLDQPSPLPGATGAAESQQLQKQAAPEGAVTRAVSPEPQVLSTVKQLAQTGIDQQIAYVIALLPLGIMLILRRKLTS